MLDASALKDIIETPPSSTTDLRLDPKRAVIQALRASIKDRAQTSRQMRIDADLQNLSGDARHAVNCARAQYGRKTRAQLLLYAMLRGHSISKVEPLSKPRTDQTNPNPDLTQTESHKAFLKSFRKTDYVWLTGWIHEAAFDFANSHELAKQLTGGYDAISGWLNS